jgi:tetratricopeptide (TPR) repeat protein
MNFHFENIWIDTDSFSVEQNGQTISVEPQVFDLIVYLIENRNRLVSRKELLEKLWSGRHVSDTSLSNHIKSARKVLGDNGRRQKVIKTFHARGYQFVANVEEVAAGAKPEIKPVRGYRGRYQFALAALVLLLLLQLSNQFFWGSDKDGLEKPIRKIAVLPFSNTKPDSDTDYFGFAISDQIIGELVYLKNMSVRSSGSIRKYSQQVNDPIVIGKELDVDYVLSGSYLKEGNIIRLNIELVEVQTNKLVWRGEQIEVNYQNAFELQDIVARRVVDGLNVEFEEAEFKRIRKDVASDPLAYEYYFRSISYPYTTDGHQLAIEMLSKSIELDPGYAPAYVQLGNRLRRLGQFGLVEPGEYQDSESYYLKALTLNSELVSALSYLAMFYTETNRIDEAVKLARQMYEINPTNANTHFTLGYIYRYAGMVDQAIQEMEKAVAIDSRNPKYRSLIGTYSAVGQYQDALDMLYLYPESPFTLGWTGLIYYHLGELEVAIDYFDQVIEIDPQGLWGHVTTVHKAYLQGEPEKGFDAIDQLKLTNVTDGETIYYIAAYYGLLGDSERCIQALKEAVDAGYFNYPFIEASSNFDVVREQPEYRQVVETAKQKHYAFRENYFNDYAAN